MYLIAGLGNIGAEYDGTRHNIGFDVVDALVLEQSGSFHTERLASVAEIKYKGKPVTCIKPTTYMNLSGKAVKYWLDRKKIPLERLLVITDDIALPLDRLRLRGAGSDAGHNGLKSIAAELLTDEYNRLRFGVGNDFPKGMQVEYVLGKWLSAEKPLVEQKIKTAVQATQTFVSAGLARAMNEYNKLVITL